MFKVPTFIDTKTIIVNLLKADKKTYLSFDRLQELLSFLYNELKDQCRLENYNIFFNVNFDAIERTVRYNEKIFGLDIEAGTIYLREPKSIDLLATTTTINAYKRGLKVVCSRGILYSKNRHLKGEDLCLILV